jgi:serine/threonine protein kinase
MISKEGLDSADYQAVLNEVDILKNLSHKNIVKVYEFFNEAKYFYIVEEMCG